MAATAGAIAAVAVALAGCGLGAGKGTSDVALTVTRDFGTVPVGSAAERQVPGSQTVMRLLERAFRVTTRYGGGFIESINGLRGTAARRDWFYYVNGIEASLGAAGTSVHRGDRIWWDLPRLERHRHDPGRGRFVPRAVRTRQRGSATAHDARLRLGRRHGLQARRGRVSRHRRPDSDRAARNRLRV